MKYGIKHCDFTYYTRLYEQTLTSFLRGMHGVSDGDEFALRASSMS